jgi:hypothetical protein
MAATSVEAFIESFPHPIIPPIEGLPTYESITDVTRLLNTNAASVHSELGGGQLGHLALTISPAIYATLSAIPFVEPANPGPVPILVPNVGTAVQIQGLIRDHKESLRLWREYNNVDAALKQQIIRAVDQLYIRTLQHRHTGFANVTARQLIQHLLTTYGNITPTDLALNDGKFRTAYDPAQTIEALFSQLEDAMDYADAGSNPYSTAQVVTNAYSLMFSTGLLPEACREWRRKPGIDKTWANFKTDFAEAHHDLRLAQGTTQEGGYHGANNAMDSFVNNTADAFANLATATASDRQMLADLTASNKKLTEQLAAKDIEIASLRNTGRGSNRVPDRSNDRPNDRNQTYNRASDRDQNDDRRRWNNKNYCWTHGYDVARTHTSQSCRWTNDGHQRDATRTNPMNGSLANKAKVM